MYRLPEHLERALTSTATIVTADPRQAFAVRLAWNEQHHSLGHVVWPSPDVLPLSTWLARMWGRAASGDEPAEHAPLLTTAQERTLWEQVVEDSGGIRDLLHPHGAARAALSTWQRIHEWAIDRRSLEPVTTEETRAFLSWAGQAMERMRDHRCIDPSRALWRCPLAGTTVEGSEFVLLGFDREPRSLSELRARLAARGLNARGAPGRAPRAAGAKLRLANAEAEVHAAARWARRRLERNPDDRLLIAIPDLAQRRGYVDYVLTDILDPASLLALSTRSGRIFALETGETLDRYPIVATALTALELAVGYLAFDTVSHWLRSPYLLAGVSAAGPRAQLDIAIRRFAAEELDLRGLRSVLRRTDQAVEKDPLIEALGRFAEKIATGPRTPAEWTVTFSDALKLIGWPGERPLDSMEYQTVEKFHGTLRELATLERLLGRLEPAAAVRALRRLLEQTAFQPETGDTAVTVTARLEDPVLNFDGIWVSGLHAGAWPETPHPDPFIPWQLQVAAGIPEASAAGMLERGRRILASWLASSQEVILSWPRRLDDEDCDPSPLIVALPDAVEQLVSPLTRAYAHVIHESAQLERVADGPAPSLALVAGHVADARALVLQSLCPFRAFAEKRLGARVVEQPQPGIDARTRGQFLHRVLEQLGNALQDSGKLHRYSLEERGAALDAALRAARNEVFERAHRWSRATIDLETERLRGLLRTWLEIEAARAPFRILAVEHEIDCTIAGVPFSLRIDRIDELADGRRLLIDYKSGRASARRWYGDRPDDPQMPLYAVAVATPPAALAYALLNADGCRFEGVSAAPAVAMGIEVVGDWPAQLREWRGAIERLAADFAGGYAQVDPKRDACSHCHLHSLCRIDELRARATAGTDDE